MPACFQAVKHSRLRTPNASMASSSAKQIVLVTGATGKQGGAVVNSLLKTGRFAVRALTRDPDSAKAKALRDLGVEVVKGDLNDKASLVEAMAKARSVFCVTDARGAGYDVEKEFQMGKAGIDAAVEAGIQHFVWSGLEDVRKTPGVSEKIPELEPGHYVPHFEVKGDITTYLEESGLPHTVVLPSMFFENFLGMFPFVKQEDGSFAFYHNLGHAKIPLNGNDAIGDTVAEVLSSPKKYMGKTIPVTAEYVSMDDCAMAISRVVGETLKYVEVPRDAAAAAGYPGAEDHANMFQYYRDFGAYKELRPVEGTVVNAQPFAEWAEANEDALKRLFK